MRRVTCSLILIAALTTGITVAAQSGTSIVRDVRAAIAAGDFAGGQAQIDAYRSARGVTPEMIAALSWMARGTYAAGLFDQATQYSVDSYKLAVEALRTSSLDDRNLEAALGAAIETDALVRAARGDRSSAVYFLERELETYRDSPIHKRLQKNINVLSLAGQPAPAFDAPEQLGAPVTSLDELKGNVVILFFWAHWCPDCKAQGPVIERVLAKYRSQGVRVVAPTQRYGYITSGQDAPPDLELAHIGQVLDQSYPFLRDEGVPVSAAVHKRYGVSTTPTLALVDREGIVRLYRPGQMTDEELEAAVRDLL